MTAAAVRPPYALGRVLSVATGVAVVEAGGARCSASFGPVLLAQVGRTPNAVPQAGDLVELRWWPDGPVTVDRVVRRGTREAVVLPLRRR